MAFKDTLKFGYLGGKLYNTLNKTDKNPYDFLSTLNPEQQQLFSQLSQQLMGGQQSPLMGVGTNYLQNLLSGSPEAFQQFEAPIKRQFQEQVIPGIAERFSGLGSGAQSSSAFQQALGQAGSGLSENLAALRGGMQMQALPQALQFAQQPISNILQLLGLNTQAIMPKQKPFWQELLMSLAPQAAKAATSFATGGI